MKEKTKRLVGMVLVLCLCISQTMTAAASEGCNGDMTLEEGALPYCRTEADEQLLQEKQKELEELKRSSLTREAKYADLPIICYVQENGYYCGPATVKQVVHYINGSSLSQSTYAGRLGTTADGTDMGKIAGVVNNAINQSVYVYDSIGTQTQWFDKIMVSIKNGQPAILDINTNGLNFPYETSGHYVNVSGYSTETALKQVRITDPYWVSSGNRWYTDSKLYAANNQHWRKAMIW